MDVLFHIVDDEGYARAIRNLAALLAPGGLLVLTENFLTGTPAAPGTRSIGASRRSAACWRTQAW